MNEKISVIIPIYNSENYLNQCIDSILNQSYENLEVILINDGSTDSSGFICDEYAKLDSRVKVIHQSNSRIGASRNNGINYATGEFITFIDSDDYLDKNTYQEAMNYIKKYDADLIQWDLEFLPEKDCGYIINNKEKHSVVELELNNIEALKKLFEWKDMDNRFNNIWTATHCIWTKLCKIELFNDIRFPEKKEYEDEMILHELLYTAKKSVFINKRFSTYRLRNNSTVHTMPLTGRMDKVEAFLDRFNLMVNINNEDLLRGSAHDYLACILNCYMIAAKENNNYVKSELRYKSIDLIKRGKKYISKIDLYTLCTLIIFPKIFEYIYGYYRKRKDR